MGAIKSLFVLMRAFLASRLSLAAEILALRQQVAVYKHTVKRPELRKRDRIFWVWLSRRWSNWRSGLVIVQPETVIQWHRQAFKLYWRWKSRTAVAGQGHLHSAGWWTASSIRACCVIANLGLAGSLPPVGVECWNSLIREGFSVSRWPFLPHHAIRRAPCWLVYSSDAFFGKDIWSPYLATAPIEDRSPFGSRLLE